MIYLYVKTHNITGLKYLGKTKSKDPVAYRGSGLRWTRHIKKHGYDVTTYVIFQSEDPEEIKQMGLHYSRLWNVVESEEWANLREESGDGGWNFHKNKPKIMKVVREKYGVDYISQSPEIKLKKTFTNRTKHGKDHYFQTEEFKAAKNKRNLEKYGSTSPAAGRFWITDGANSKTIRPSDDIPLGWYKGRTIIK